MQQYQRLILAINQLVQSQWPLLFGLVVLYIPTVSRLSERVWGFSDQAHGPLILAVVIYLFWLKKDSLKPNVTKRNIGIGVLVILTGLLFYVVGRSQALIAFEVGSALFVILGLLIIQYGSDTLKTYWFPLFFMAFMIPLPGSLLDVVTVPMKIAVSTVAEQILYWFEYPVARKGVIIHISQYKLFVANACAGMHTLISLEALGLLYITLVKHASFKRNLILGMLIIPISFIANVIRVITLILVTYYLGDATAQGFIHSFASVLLFAVALVLIVSIDAAIQQFIRE